MRIAAAFLTLVGVAACGVAPTQSASEQELIRQDGWRQQQAERDAQAILDGMAQARYRAQQLARTSR
jgi:hypothetical protein